MKRKTMPPTVDAKPSDQPRLESRYASRGVTLTLGRLRPCLRTFAATLSAVILASLFICPSQAQAHLPIGSIVGAVHLSDGQIPVVDGELDDWQGVPPALRMSAFRDLVAEAEPDAADFDVQVWIGWSDTENRLYLAAEVTDDIHQVDRPAGSATTMIFQDDDLEIFIDADHSGGQFADFSDLSPAEQLVANGTEANHFVLAGPHEDGEDFINFSAAGWYALKDGPYTQARIRHDGIPGGPGRTRYEMSLVLFDRVNVTADFLSAVHDLQAEELVGFNLEFSDFDAKSTLFDAKWSLSGGFNAFRLSERFTDLRLEPPVVPTHVQNLSWARIKASFRP